MNRIPFLVGIISFAVYRLTFYLTGNAWLSLLIFLIPISLLIISFLFRKSLIYSKWFLSPLNISLEKSFNSIQSEISSDLLYEKLLEVAEDSQFTLLDTDKTTLSLLLGTSINFWTWGENVYIKIVPTQNGSIINFTSVTLFGNTSWKRNENNFDSFIQAFESSLTI
jgi:hypothetical protein